ncbi:class I SAM-dependent methyltransferase [Actinomadura litoris]|uniref:class I SAM-dependent methyltransferase n=1 Tax=Actinomadura litoris TaxID=2678616 RepID=UPI001FA725C7|nr:methyltransferase domain-containing protein [Actinomadura litoris]
MSSTADRVVRRWSTGRASTRAYALTIRHERLYRLLSRVVWGSDVRSFHDGIAALAAVPAGSSVLDVPCGGGVAFRGLDPGVPVRYVAADASPFMLDRARAEAARRGLKDIEYVETGVVDMPFEDGAFDLCVSFHGLHCFTDPAAALREMGRVLRPGGELRGTAVVNDGHALSRLVIAHFRRSEEFGRPMRADDVRRWLAGAGFTEPSLDRQGAYLAFSARR